MMNSKLLTTTSSHSKPACHRKDVAGDTRNKLSLEADTNDDLKKINTHVKCDSGVDVGDVNLVFASNEAIYKECTIPLSEITATNTTIETTATTNPSSNNNDTRISIDLARGPDQQQQQQQQPQQDHSSDSNALTSESGKLMNDDQAELDDGLCEISLTTNNNSNSNRATAGGKSSTYHEDMMQSINNLRLNVNNHILGGSKNVIGRMRKLSLNELNRHRSSQGRKYKVAFYVCLAALSILFLYLIYQNLFNDR